MRTTETAKPGLARQPPPRPQKFSLGLAMGVAAGALVALGIGWGVQTATVQGDQDRGERFGEMMGDHPDLYRPERGVVLDYCETAAESVYGSEMFDGTGSASRAQQAFYYGCSGDPVGEFGQ